MTVKAMADRRGQGMNPALLDLRDWLWDNFGWDIYEWKDDDIRF